MTPWTARAFIPRVISTLPASDHLHVTHELFVERLQQEAVGDGARGAEQGAGQRAHLHAEVVDRRTDAHERVVHHAQRRLAVRKRDRAGHTTLASHTYT